MADFRYAQFCPLARAAELLGERWTLLILRELTLGPQRFSDLRRRLGSVSSSVLTDRLTRMETRGLVRQRLLSPPAASTVYELAEAGDAARPLLRELMRWGVRFLLPPVPGDQFEAAWVRAVMETFARKEATPQVRFEVRIPDGDDEIVMRIEGGVGGTRVHDGPGPADIRLRADPSALMAVLAGAAEPGSVLETTASDGPERSSLDALPLLFDLADALASVARENRL